MKIFKNRTYYTLSDIWTEYGESLTSREFSANALVDIIASLFDWSASAQNENEFSDYSNTFEYETNYYVLNSTVNKLVAQVLNRQWDNYLFGIDDEEMEDDSTIKAKVAAQWFASFLFILESTAPYYKDILTLYDNNISKLMDQVKTSTDATNRFNDTPQTSGGYVDETYTSNINISSIESASDMGTVMSRLQEIQVSYKRLMQDWANEFNKLFLAKENL